MSTDEFPSSAASGPDPAAAARPAPGGSVPGTHDLRAARVVAAGLLVSKPSGYVRDALLAARFGTGSAMGAYTLASTAATAIFDVIGTPLTRVLVPVLVAARRRRGAAGLARTAMAVFWAEVALALLAAVLLLVFAGPLAAALAGRAGVLRTDLTVLLRWLSLLPCAMVLSAYATAWLQAAERFTLPAFTGLPFDLSIIAFVLFFGHHGILAAAWGLLLGTCAQYALQWPGLRRFGHRVRLLRPREALGDPGLGATATMALPLLGSAAAVETVNLLQQALAARLPVGTVAALGYAFRVLDLPSALFILPATAVILPRLAAFAAAGEAGLADGLFREAAWALLTGLLPCALLLGALGGPLAAALYEHGAFGARSATAMARCLVGFSPGVVTYGLQQLLRARFYARQDARTPLRWDIAALVATAAFDLLTYHAMGGLGLALGWSAGSAVAWAGLSAEARRAAPRPAGGPELVPLAAGAAALLTAVLLLHGHVPAWLGHRPWRVGLAEVATVGPAAAGAYFLAVAATGGRALLRGLGGQLRRS